MPTLPWETPRLILRSFAERDLARFVAYRSDPLVARYQTWNAPYPEADARLLLQMMQRSVLGAPGEWYQIAVELKSEGALIGDLMFHVASQDGQQGEFGVTFARPYQGQGYATEALRRLLAYAFEELHLHRVIARLDTRNIRSAKLMERLGMRREAHFLQSFFIKGGWTDEYWYAILSEEWPCEIIPTCPPTRLTWPWPTAI